MKTIFDRLLKISNSYKETVDDLAKDYDLDGRRDYLYADEIKAQRIAERNDRFNGLLDKAAERALAEATEAIDKLRGAVREYVTSSDDTGTLATLQALVSAGVDLSDSELAAFSEKGGFATWKLLEKHTGGKIKGPQMTALDADLKELTSFFKNLAAFRGELAGINSASPWGQRPETGSVIMRGQIDKFPEKLGEMQARWAILER